MHSFSVVEVVITFYLQMGGKRKKCPHGRVGSGPFQGAVALEWGPTAAVRQPRCKCLCKPLWVLSQSLLLNSQVRKDLSV